jgi:hypothetical protein
MGHRVLAKYGVTAVAASAKEDLMSKDYPGIYEHLRELMARLGADAPGVMRGFAALHSPTARCPRRPRS